MIFPEVHLCLLVHESRRNRIWEITHMFLALIRFKSLLFDVTIAEEN